MTDPTADAAKLLPCQHEVLHFGSGDYYLFCANCNKSWMLRRPNIGSGAREYDLEQNVGGWPEGSSPSPENGERRVPPAGESDLPDWPKRDGFCPVCNGNDYDAPCAYPTERPTGCWRVERLGLAARPKVEDAEVVTEQRDYIQRLEGLLNEAATGRDRAEAKLAEREAELAKADAELDWIARHDHQDREFGPAMNEARKRHAARQQQKASAEPDVMEQIRKSHD